MSIEFFVPGVPRPQGSKRTFAHPHGGRPMLVEDSKRVRPWRGDVRSVAASAITEPVKRDVPVHVVLAFVFSRPKSHIGAKGLTAAGKRKPRPSGKPDVDKLARAILDALTGVAYIDDSQVTALNTCKVWGTVPGAYIKITAVERSTE